MAIPESGTQSQPVHALYWQVLRNRSFVLLWSGATTSTIGDTFFNLAVMWIIFMQSHSALQTSLIQVVWHLDKILFGPLAGVIADRWSRKRIMLLTSMLQVGVVATLAVIFMIRGQASTLTIFITVFLLNSLYTFFRPASDAIMPEIIERNLLITASGLSSASGQSAAIIGSMLGGIVVAIMGVVGALLGDALSFLYAALTIALARLPEHAIHARQHVSSEKSPSFIQEFIEGWRVLAGQPVVRALTWLIVLVNIASFLGPLWIVLITQRLHGNAVVFGISEAIPTIAAIAGGVCAGVAERRIGTGRLLVLGWGINGLSILGIAASTSLLLTIGLATIGAFFSTLGGVACGALLPALIPNEYRGRVGGITRALNVIAIPISALIGGWLADRLGVTWLFVAGGVWVLGVAVLAWSNRHIRTVRL